MTRKRKWEKYAAVARHSVERLRDQLAYDPETGIISWKKNKRSDLVGKIAGTRHEKTGYRHLMVDNKFIKAHQAAWAIFYGEIPLFDIDHEDTDKSNDRIKNLRKSNGTLNKANRPKQEDNTSGFKGVFFVRGSKRNPWMAQLQAFGTYSYLGVFPTREEAAEAYNIEALERFGEHALLNAVKEAP